MPSADGHAVRAELNCYTKHVTAGVTVQFRSHSSKIDKIESVLASQRILRSEARQPWPMKRWSHSSLQVIDPKASAAPSWSGMMSATIPRSMSDPLDGQCMLTAVLRRCSSVRQVTAVEGDTPSKVHDVTMLIDAAH